MILRRVGQLRTRSLVSRYPLWPRTPG